MKNIFLTGILLYVILGTSFGQNTTVIRKDIFYYLQEDTKGAKVKINQDIRINNLMRKQIQCNQKQAKIPGWRIRIFSDLGQQSKESSLAAQSKFLSNYPDIPVYRIYDSPNYKVYVGDFRTKDEAIKLIRQLKSDFRNAFPVPMYINFPVLE